MATGAFDGIMIDCWQETDAQIALLQRVRKAIGDEALIIINSNRHELTRSAPYINGQYMEVGTPQTAAEWRQVESSLQWAERNVRRPSINCLESAYLKSRGDLHRMRATTTMVLTMSEGFALFADPNENYSPDHLHDWYPFWDVHLGHPEEPGQTMPDGSVHREYTHGTVVYNPMGNREVTVAFDSPRRSAATGKTATSHIIAACDGDIFLTDTATGGSP
jgi:hypothetical protein